MGQNVDESLAEVYATEVIARDISSVGLFIRDSQDDFSKKLDAATAEANSTVFAASDELVKVFCHVPPARIRNVAKLKMVTSDDEPFASPLMPVMKQSDKAGYKQKQAKVEKPTKKGRKKKGDAEAEDSAPELDFWSSNDVTGSRAGGKKPKAGKNYFYQQSRKKADKSSLTDLQERLKSLQ